MPTLTVKAFPPVVWVLFRLAFRMGFVGKRVQIVVSHLINIDSITERLWHFLEYTVYFNIVECLLSLIVIFLITTMIRMLLDMMYIYVYVYGMAFSSPVLAFCYFLLEHFHGVLVLAPSVSQPFRKFSWRHSCLSGSFCSHSLHGPQNCNPASPCVTMPS